ncbi:tyrosine-type recombinase/integrase [Pseudarthrobacter raffinosi]|uniref:tyrosine-type recombinase/integrase n=1 Tax=Pseudarthrobacter raffinosi TaxID=2953651 RepID=UPI0035AB7BFB
MAWQTARKVLPGIGDGWHQLRHHHASLLIAAGLSPVAMAHRLGHKDATETLQTYAHLWPNDDERMAAASDGLLVLPEVETP